MIDFLCVGAHKSGTSWLHANIGQHPDVWTPPAKELHFFDDLESGPLVSEQIKRLQWLSQFLQRDVASMDRAHLRLLAPMVALNWRLLRDRVVGGDNGRAGSVTRRVSRSVLDRYSRYLVANGLRDARLRWAVDYATRDYPRRNLEWYFSLFDAGRARGKKLGEVTPAYAILSRRTYRLIKNAAPDVKIIFVMRNPIWRLWSSFRFDRLTPKRVGLSDELTDFEPDDVMAYAQKPGVVARSDYISTLINLQSVFGEDNLLVDYYEGIGADPMRMLARVCRHLGIEFRETYFESPGERSLPSKPSPIPPAVYDELRSLHAPMVSEVYGLLGAAHTDWREDFPQ